MSRVRSMWCFDNCRELQLGLRTFGKFASDEETRQIMQQVTLSRKGYDTVCHDLSLPGLSIGQVPLLANNPALLWLRSPDPRADTGPLDVSWCQQTRRHSRSADAMMAKRKLSGKARAPTITTIALLR